MEKKLSNISQHAIREMDVLLKLYPEPDNQPIIEPFREEIIALMEAFATKGGHSGNSIVFAIGAVAEAIKKLGNFMPIAPITGDNEEWGKLNDYGGSDIKPYIEYQNKRCGTCFKESDGTYTYLDAIRWKTESGGGWSGPAILPNGRTILSKGGIKSFPFTPKTFTIPVREVEVAPDNWEFHIDDESVLDEVKEYYNLIFK